MKSKIIDKGNYKIHLFKTKRFKSIEVHVLLRNEVKLDNYLLKAFQELLYLTTEHYKTKLDRYIKQEELYNASIEIGPSRYGRENIFDYNITFINPKLVKDDYTNDVIEFLYDIINHPLFDEKRIEEVKDKMKFNYRNLIERPETFARINAKDLYFEDELDNVRFNVSEEIVNTITMDQIENKYNEIIYNSIVDIYVLGDVDDTIVDIIEKHNNLKSTDIVLNQYVFNPFVDKVKEQTDIKKDIKQAQIVMIYNTPKYESRLHKILSLYSLIFGGSSLTSRLFDVVREKNSLCYNIHSSYIYNDSLLCITTSVDIKNIDKTLKLINEVYESMKEITDEELANAKTKLISEYESIEDELYGLYCRLIMEELLGRESLEKEIDEINSITKEEVMNVNNIIKLNTLYVLKGE